MPIRINLLAEDQELEEMRRRNPVKRALWVSGFVLFLVLLWGLTLFLKILVAGSEVASFDSRWKQMEKSVKQVEDGRRLNRELQRKLSALAQFTTNRFLWANALDALQQTCVENAQLVRVKVEQIYVQNDPLKAAPPVPLAAAAMPAPANPPVPAAPAPAKPAVAVEKIVVSLEGRDYGSRTGEQVPRYKESLLAFPFFQSHLQKTNSIMLTSLSAPQTDPIKKTAFVQFGLQLNFQEKERRLYE
jgi:hypothetical protein